MKEHSRPAEWYADPEARSAQTTLELKPKSTATFETPTAK